MLKDVFFINGDFITFYGYQQSKGTGVTDRLGGIKIGYIRNFRGFSIFLKNDIFRGFLIIIKF